MGDALIKNRGGRPIVRNRADQFLLDAYVDLRRSSGKDPSDRDIVKVALRDIDLRGGYIVGERQLRLRSIELRNAGEYPRALTATHARTVKVSRPTE